MLLVNKCHLLFYLFDSLFMCPMCSPLFLLDSSEIIIKSVWSVISDVSNSYHRERIFKICSANIFLGLRPLNTFCMFMEIQQYHNEIVIRTAIFLGGLCELQFPPFVYVDEGSNCRKYNNEVKCWLKINAQKCLCLYIGLCLQSINSLLHN